MEIFQIMFMIGWGDAAASRYIYCVLVITPQAIRGEALAETSPAIACITRDVPPLLKTELLSEPRVTYGAVVLACAVPSASTVSTKLGMSPAIMPVGLWSAPAALK